MSVHTIRLAGPWEHHGVEDEAVRIQLPCDLQPTGPDQFLVRRFHRPTGLSDGCQVLLVLTATGSEPTVWINDDPLSASEVADLDKARQYLFDITSNLQPFNALRVQRADRNERSIRLQAAVLQIHEP